MATGAEVTETRVRPFASEFAPYEALGYSDVVGEADEEVLSAAFVIVLAWIAADEGAGMFRSLFANELVANGVASGSVSEAIVLAVG